MLESSEPLQGSGIRGFEDSRIGDSRIGDSRIGDSRIGDSGSVMSDE
jgi:hypothetical protein